LSAQNNTELDNLLFFRITLPKKQQIENIYVQEFHKGRREPYPKVIRVYEKQTVELFESKYYLSVYPTKESIVDFRVKASDVKYKSHEPTSTDQDYYTYGPYKDIAPITFEQIQIFFTYPYPLPFFSKATRDVYVSHWGSIAIDEYFKIFN